jgi:nicotinate dehydrogenase subunit A
MADLPQPVLTLEVNGQRHALPGVPRHAPLLQVLRNDLCLNGPKYGCGLGECGACLVLVDGTPARSCVIPAGGVEGREITTLEGLPARAGAAIHPVQQAYIDAQAAQCGYCLNGMIIATVGLLEAEPNPTDARVRAALSHNLCRCGTHLEILDAVQRSAVAMAAHTGAPRASVVPRRHDTTEPVGRAALVVGPASAIASTGATASNVPPAGAMPHASSPRPAAE